MKTARTVLSLLALLWSVSAAHADDVGENSKTSFTRTATINLAERREVHHFYANAVALEAARTGRPLPEGSVLLVEVHSVKIGSRNRPLMGCDGFLVADRLVERREFTFDQPSEVAAAIQ